MAAAACSRRYSGKAQSRVFGKRLGNFWERQVRLAEGIQVLIRANDGLGVYREKISDVFDVFFFMFFVFMVLNYSQIANLGLRMDCNICLDILELSKL